MKFSQGTEVNIIQVKDTQLNLLDLTAGNGNNEIIQVVDGDPEGISVDAKKFSAGWTLKAWDATANNVAGAIDEDGGTIAVTEAAEISALNGVTAGSVDFTVNVAQYNSLLRIL